jgi:hypothetical protein
LIVKNAPGGIRPIAGRIHRETAGNPFHVGLPLLWILEENNLLVDVGRQEWGPCDDDRTHCHETAAPRRALHLVELMLMIMGVFCA